MVVCSWFGGVLDELWCNRWRWRWVAWCHRVMMGNLKLKKSNLKKKSGTSPSFLRRILLFSQFVSSAQKNAQFFNFSVLDSVLYTTATTNKLLRLPPLFHFLHLCSSIYNIVMSRRQHGKRSQEVCIDLIDQYRTDYPTASLECILQSISTRHHVSTRQLRRWYYHYLEWGEYQYQTRAKIQHFRRKYKSLYRSKRNHQQQPRILSGWNCSRVGEKSRSLLTLFNIL